MNVVALPSDPQALSQALADLLRRAIDGTVVPLFLDVTNQRVIIGAITASTSPNGKLEVTGDMKVLGAGNGIILPTRNGLKFGRLILENPDANGNIVISCDPL